MNMNSRNVTYRHRRHFDRTTPPQAAAAAMHRDASNKGRLVDFFDARHFWRAYRPQAMPEMPYDIDRVCGAVERRAKKGSNFSIIAVAEGALNEEEAKLKRKEWTAKRAEAGYTTATSRIAAAVQKKTGMETRVCIPGHMQRGGSPSAYDRVLATQFGSYAAKLVEIERYGVTVALVNGHVTANRLEDIAGKTRNVPEGCELLTVARRMGVSLG